jgi:hypothetical protein
VSGQLHAPAALPPAKSRSGRLVKWKFLTLPGFELQPLGRPAHSQSLYRLHYPGSFLSPLNRNKFLTVNMQSRGYCEYLLSAHKINWPQLIGPVYFTSPDRHYRHLVPVVKGTDRIKNCRIVGKCLLWPWTHRSLNIYHLALSHWRYLYVTVTLVTGRWH